MTIGYYVDREIGNFREVLMRVMREPLTQQEREQHQIWINQNDIRFRARHDDRSGGVYVAGRYEQVVFRDPQHVMFSILGDDLEKHPQYRDTLNSLKIESLQAIQRSVENYIVDGMLQSAYRRNGYVPHKDLYVPHERSGYYRFDAKYFPSVTIKHNEVLVVLSQEMYHRLMLHQPPKENPDALVGKIEWVDGYL